ncbi:hypothetical protein NKJ06_06630 [Mesorhizobium sp. M0293]|uniref:hypothetical protein n=1 Tax=unclassified Mesorhizobium TaxID=325217 RepID=UPI0033377797
MYKTLLDYGGPQALLAFYCLVAAVGFMTWLILPIRDTRASLIASILGWISAFFVLLVALVFRDSDRFLQHGIGGGLDVPALICLVLLPTDIVPIMAFFLFGRVVGRVAKRIVRGH